MTEDDNQPVELAFGIGPDGANVEVAFADGRFVIPPHVVAELGGTNEIEKIANDLSAVTFEQFMEGFYAELTSRKVNSLMADHVARHFNRLF